MGIAGDFPDSQLAVPGQYRHDCDARSRDGDPRSLFSNFGCVFSSPDLTDPGDGLLDPSEVFSAARVGSDGRPAAR